MKRKLFAVLLIWCLLFTGCTPTPAVPNLPPEQPPENPPTEQQPEQPTEPELQQIEYPLVGEWYALRKIDDTVYLDILDPSFESKDTIPYMVELQPVTFSSIAEMYERITNFQLTESEMKIIANQFAKNANGMIPIFDLNKLPVMRLPDGYYLRESVEWYGNSCRQIADHPDSNEYSIWFTCYSNRNYEAIVGEVQDTLNKGDYIVTVLEDRNAVSYLAEKGTSRSIVYELTQDEKKIFVKEYYLLRPNQFGGSVSATLPSSLTIHGTENEIYFKVSDGGVYPDIDVISALGVELFVPGKEYNYGYDVARYQITYPIEHEWYTLRKIEDTVYFDVSDSFVVNKTENYYIANITFSSLNEMYTRIVKGQLTTEEINIIADDFSKDETGMIPIIDLNKLPSPTFPRGYQPFFVSWSGDYVMIRAHDPLNANRPMLTFHYDLQASIENYKDKNIDAFERGYNGGYYSKTELTDRGAIAYVHVSNPSKYIISTIHEGEKTFYVREKYVLARLSGQSYLTHVSDTIPKEVEIYGIENGITFKVTIEDGKLFGGYPPVTYITSLGVAFFVPEEAAA